MRVRYALWLALALVSQHAAPQPSLAQGANDADAGVSSDPAAAGTGSRLDAEKNRRLVDTYTDDHGCRCSSVGAHTRETAVHWWLGLPITAVLVARRRRR